jgi:hypothetical protein
MPVTSSGQVSLDDIHVEAGGTTGTECSLNDSDIRELVFPRSSGAASQFDDFYGTEKYPTTGGQQNTGYNYAGGSLASGTGTLYYTMGVGNVYTTTSRTIWVGFVNSTDSQNIDMIISASSTGLRCKVDLIRSPDYYVKSGTSGTAAKMYKETSVSTSSEKCFEGSTGSGGYAWGSTSTRWPIRIMADAGITFTSNASGRVWQFRNTTRYTNVSSTHFAIAFDQGVQA